MAPKTALIAFVSATSLYGVDVPCALMYPTCSGSTPERVSAERIISDTPTDPGSGWAMW